MNAIFKREFRSYFNSMTGPVVTAVLLCFGGIYFMAYNLGQGYPYFSYTLLSMRMVLLIAVPVLTMRSMAEERHSKTDQLWLTAPISVGKVICGKFFAMAAVLGVPLLALCTCPLVIAMNGQSYLLADYSSLLAFFLLGCVYIAVGMLLSSLTESQVISAISTFGVLLLLYLWDDLLNFLPSSAVGSLVGFAVLLVLLCLLAHGLFRNWIVTLILGAAGAIALVVGYLLKPAAFAGLLTEVLGKFSLGTVITNFAYSHVFDLRGLLLYLSLTALLLFLTVQVVQKRRWS